MISNKMPETKEEWNKYYAEVMDKYRCIAAENILMKWQNEEEAEK